MTRRIPIRNLYYLLCYAWDVLEERDDQLVSELDGLSHADLLAKVLVVSVQRLWRRGLARGYRTRREELRSPRGRLDVPAMVARRLEERALAACEYDELDRDILANQILATTARRLSVVASLAPELRAELIAVGRTLGEAATIPLTAATFTQVPVHGHLRPYRLALQVCELVHAQLFVDEQRGEVRFRDFVEDERRMATLFEEFVRNFYRRELRGWSVKRDVIAWDLEPITPGAARYLPQMMTDISLRGPGRTIIIDTKYYLEAFASRFGAEKLRAGHLYQLTAYLRNLAEREADAAGVLLYPEVDSFPTLQYGHGRHRVTAMGLDLTLPWRRIHQRLLELVAIA